MNRKPSNVAMGTPVAEFAVDEELVSRLLSAQHSDLAHLPLRAIDAGWDNTMFRLGEHLAVRLPRRSVAATLITHEQHWLQSLAKQLPLPVPAPCRVGKPALGYPWPWSIVPWLKGLTADQSEPGESQAVAFARFLCALHVPAPADAPLNYMRGVSLGQRAPSINARIRRLKERTHLITPGIEQVWNEALAAPIDVASTWLHGDLHPRNVIVHEGVITGVVDWGDLTSGDCATDLASLWMLFAQPDTRQKALQEYSDVSPATMARAKGWAALFGVILSDTGLCDNPQSAALGKRILQQLSDIKS